MKKIKKVDGVATASAAGVNADNVKEQMKGTAKEKSGAANGPLQSLDILKPDEIKLVFENANWLYYWESHIGYHIEKDSAWVSIESICGALKLDPAPYVRTIIEDRRLIKGIHTFTCEGKTYNQVYLEPGTATAWLHTISPEQVAPEMRNKLLCFQRGLCGNIYADAGVVSAIQVDRTLMDTIQKVKRLCGQIEGGAQELDREHVELRCYCQRRMSPQPFGE